MTMISKHTEMVIRIAYKPGALSNPMAFARSCGVDVLATCSYWDGVNSFLLLVAGDPDKAGRAFQAAGYDYSTRPIILAGPLDSTADGARYGDRLAAARINIRYAYAYQTECNQFFQVFRTTDDDRAMRVLQAKPIGQEADSRNIGAGVFADDMRINQRAG